MHAVTNREIKNHTEQTWIEAIHRLAVTSSVCRVAVAYCGNEGYTFFPEKLADRPENLKVIIDASDDAVRRGLTNPEGLKRLLGLTPQLRTLKSLHAKVFIFDRRVALVGSTNMSTSSLNQFQMALLEVFDPKVIRRLVQWFDNTLWSQATPIDSEIIRKLMRLWPRHDFHGPTRRMKTRLPKWHGEAPQPPLDPSEFTVSISNQKLQRLLSEFRNNKCQYPKYRNVSCDEAGKDIARIYREGTKELSSLWRRRESWRRQELAELFDLTFINGRQAKLIKPQFVRQNPRKVVKSLEFLLQGPGDPYVRFEKMLAKGSSYKLVGLGEVGVICLMHLWRPTEFALFAEPVDKALKTLVDFGRPVSLRKGQGYKDRTAAAREIVKLTRLKTFGRVDHFLDALGKKHIG